MVPFITITIPLYIITIQPITITTPQCIITTPPTYTITPPILPITTLMVISILTQMHLLQCIARIGTRQIIILLDMIVTKTYPKTLTPCIPIMANSNLSIINPITVNPNRMVCIPNKHTIHQADIHKLHQAIRAVLHKCILHTEHHKCIQLVDIQ